MKAKYKNHVMTFMNKLHSDWKFLDSIAHSVTQIAFIMQTNESIYNFCYHKI